MRLQTHIEFMREAWQSFCSKYKAIKLHVYWFLIALCKIALKKFWTNAKWAKIIRNVFITRVLSSLWITLNTNKIKETLKPQLIFSSIKQHQIRSEFFRLGNILIICKNSSFIHESKCDRYYWAPFFLIPGHVPDCSFKLNIT